MERNLVTFMKEHNYDNSLEICLDWNTLNGEWISDTYDIEAFNETLKIF